MSRRRSFCPRSFAMAVASIAIAASLTGSATAAGSFPESIPLPDGFQPEGIAVGRGTSFYVGSIPTGQIFRGDLATGEGDVFIDPPEGRVAAGLAVDRFNRLFVAGGPTGQAYVYDAGTGAELATYQLTENDAFINDVVITHDGAWFTDSFAAALYPVPFGDGESLGAQDDVKTLTVGGDFAMQDGFNLNGIEKTRGGDTLVVVQSNTGKLFTVDPATGLATEIDLGGDDVTAGDGILFKRDKLYVVQNAFNQVAVVELSADLSSGSVAAHLTDPDLDVPTTTDDFGGALYVVNARFGVPEPETASYTVERLEL
jgi:outer membrane protein assembly factor BamB